MKLYLEKFLHCNNNNNNNNNSDDNNNDCYYEIFRMFPSIMPQSSVLVYVGKAPRLLDLRIGEKAAPYKGASKVALKTCFADP
jgi:hypothetical protein